MCCERIVMLSDSNKSATSHSEQECVNEIDVELSSAMHAASEDKVELGCLQAT